MNKHKSDGIVHYINFKYIFDISSFSVFPKNVLGYICFEKGLSGKLL